MTDQKIQAEMFCRACETGVLPDEYPHDILDGEYSWECPNCGTYVKSAELTPKLTFSEAEANQLKAFQENFQALVIALGNIAIGRDGSTRRVQRIINRDMMAVQDQFRHYQM